jgi:hypothetical protein
LHTFAEAYLARAIAFCDNNVMFAGNKSAPNTATSINQTTSLSLIKRKTSEAYFSVSCHKNMILPENLFEEFCCKKSCKESFQNF